MGHHACCPCVVVVVVVVVVEFLDSSNDLEITHRVGYALVILKKLFWHKTCRVIDYSRHKETHSLIISRICFWRGKSDRVATTKHTKNSKRSDNLHQPCSVTKLLNTTLYGKHSRSLLILIKNTNQEDTPWKLHSVVLRIFWDENFGRVEEYL